MILIQYGNVFLHFLSVLINFTLIEKGKRLEEILCVECNVVETDVHFLCQYKKYKTWENDL